MRWFFAFFFFSGFCSLLYEVIWLRLGMAHFGVTTPVVSIFLSLFMAGLGIGSWITGRCMRNVASRSGNFPLRLYALAELLIGLSAWAVPREMGWAKTYLENYGTDLSASSSQYYWIAGPALALILLPWCTCMGATFPLAMAAIRKMTSASERSFSFLYVANVLGAVVGALLPAFVLIEIFGFRGTIKLAAVCNMTIAAVAFLLSLRAKHVGQQLSQPSAAAAPPASKPLLAASGKLILVLLFLTGLVSLAMEVVWIRQFTPYMGTEVYAFAWILGCYLIGTFVGSRTYRRWLRKHAPGEQTIAWLLLGLAGLLPLLLSDPRLPGEHFSLMAPLRVALGIMPISSLMGFLTPMLVDQYSEGDPDRAGKAYAVNVAGCILGPLISGFLLLPSMGERWSLMVLSLPLFALLYALRARSSPLPARYPVRVYAEIAALALVLIVFTRNYYTSLQHYEMRTDYAATVVASGEGWQRKLLVNGVGVTGLTPITKMMAHLPLAFHAGPRVGPPKDALVICFGMGTTHRAMLSWGIHATAVELVPSVPTFFDYYHPGGSHLLESPRSHLVIDDGRLYLEKTRQQFDVITIDPPPPTSAAGVSLLYSRQFYEIAKRRLRPGGILQQWAIGDDPGVDLVAMIKALQAVFPHVRCMVSVAGWGFHCLASMDPIPDFSPAELAAHMPTEAIADMLEWGPGRSAQEQFTILLSRELNLPHFVARIQKFDVPPLDDDRPVNEYYLLRSHLPARWLPMLQR
ncbi:MAG TPA: hypothetical protein VN176_07475 [Verrucomicrobiae bacterium]|nr:hypothetical protein [Verrucomicrobiae bacterium]